MTTGKRRQPADFGISDEAGPPAPKGPETTSVRHIGGGRRPEASGRAEHPSATGRSQRASQHAESFGPPPAWPIYGLAAAVSGLWICAPIAFALGYRNQIAPFNSDVFALLVLGLLVVGPAMLIWLAAYTVRQGQRLAAETRRAKLLTDEMVWPAIAAGLNAGDVVQGVREEILLAGEATAQARESLSVLRQALAAETEKLAQAAATSGRTAQELATMLGREREEMGALGQSLDAQAAKVADLIGQQARLVTEASDLAETQLREAQASLAARAADLTAAAGEASDAARSAGDDLNRHVARLESAGLGVADQIRALGGGLNEQRAGLASLTETLKADQQEFASRAEDHAGQLTDFIAQARLSAAEMGDRAVKSADTLRQLIAEASDRLRTLTEGAKADSAQLGQWTAQSLASFSEAAAQERARIEGQTRAAIEGLARAAEETRAAAARQALATREQVDQLSEAAFAAGQKANQAFETRLTEARELIEHSAEMIEQAGAAMTRKLDEGAAATRATLQELQDLLGQVEKRAAELPAAARGQAEQVRAAVTDSLDELMDQARRAAEETQAIDEAFQDRVRRNYEILSEAVKMMGSAAMAGSATTAARAAPQDAPRRFAGRRGAKAEAETELGARPLQETERDAPAGDSGAARRLKLTPTATDDEFASVFEASGGKMLDEGAEGDGWTWKELLSSIDGAGGDADPARLEAGLVREVAKLGINPAALLSSDTIEEIVMLRRNDDLAGARNLVRQLTPAAIRRIVRSLSADEAARDEVEKRLRLYRVLLDDAARRDPEGVMSATLLGSEAGCAYLVLEAAVAEMA